MASETTALAVGAYATFIGYAIPEGQEAPEPILEVGQRVVVDQVNEDGGYAVFAVDAEGNALIGENGQPIGDTAFPEEVEAEEVEETSSEEVSETAEVSETTETSTEAAPAAEKPKRSAGKAPAATKEKGPTKAEQKAAEKAAKDKEKADAKAAADKVKADAKAAKEKAAADKKAAADAKKTSESDDPLMISVEQTKSVAAILSESSDALVAAKMLVNRSEQTDFTLGGVLHNIYITGAFKKEGYDGKRGFNDYVEKELGVQYRKARYLISIYTTFAQVFRAKGITEDDLLKLGWSKAKELARIPVNKLVEDYDDLMALANDPNKSRDELTAHITSNYEVQKRETVTQIKFGFSLIAEAAETAKAALEQAKPLTGKENATDSDAFEYIMGDWLNTAGGSDTTLEQLIALAAAQFGVTLVEAPAEADAGSEEAAAEEATA